MWVVVDNKITLLRVNVRGASQKFPDWGSLKILGLTLVTGRYGPLQSHPLRNLCTGSIASRAPGSISGTPTGLILSGSACSSAYIFVICSNLPHFSRNFIFVDRKTSHGAWSGKYEVGWQPPCCFGLKIAEQTKPRGLVRCRYANVSPVCAGCVGVFSWHPSSRNSGHR